MIVETIMQYYKDNCKIEEHYNSNGFLYHRIIQYSDGQIKQQFFDENPDLYNHLIN